MSQGLRGRAGRVDAAGLCGIEAHRWRLSRDGERPGATLQVMALVHEVCGLQSIALGHFSALGRWIPAMDASRPTVFKKRASLV